MNKYIITHETIKNQKNEEKDFIVSALYDHSKKMVEVTLTPEEEESLLGNIYIGRVENVISNIRAAFVKISPKLTCYLSFDDLENAFFTKKQSKKKELVAGDELLVQVEREAIKTKEPSVTTNLSFSGKYAVLTTAKRRLGISSKLSGEEKKHYKELLKDFDTDEYGLIVRTNSATVSDEILLNEIQELKQEWKNLKESAPYKSCYSVLKKNDPPYLSDIINQREGSIDEIITDNIEIYETIAQKYVNGNLTLTLYQDPMISLSSFYSIKSSLEKALREQIWLKSGASIILQYTEALTVIDVNSGKNIRKKEMDENVLRINIEAAREIAYQLRLRNISGIIIIDFINLTSKEDEAVLLKEFRTRLKEDPVKTDLIDMTKLGLVEVTRKKIKKSLRDSLKMNER